MGRSLQKLKINRKKLHNLKGLKRHLGVFGAEGKTKGQGVGLFGRSLANVIGQESPKEQRAWTENMGQVIIEDYKLFGGWSGRGRGILGERSLRLQ